MHSRVRLFHCAAFALLFSPNPLGLDHTASANYRLHTGFRSVIGSILGCPMMLTASRQLCCLVSSSLPVSLMRKQTRSNPQVSILCQVHMDRSCLAFASQPAEGHSSKAGNVFYSTVEATASTECLLDPLWRLLLPCVVSDLCTGLAAPSLGNKILCDIDLMLSMTVMGFLPAGSDCMQVSTSWHLL